MYTNYSFIMPNPSNLPKLNVAKIFWFKVEGWCFKDQLKLWCQEQEPMKAYVIDQSRNESVVMSHYLLPPVNHRSLTGRPVFFTITDCNWPIKIQILTASRWQGSSPVECLPKGWKVCGSNLCHSTLIWNWALHLHLAPAAHINIMLLRRK